MAKTYIGVDIDRSRLHMVCLEPGEAGLTVRALASRDIDGIEQAAEAVAATIEDWGVPTARLAAVLPSGQLLLRRLTFPFNDARKVAAAVPLELDAQLPLDLQDHLLSIWPAGSDGELHRSLALAVPEAEVAEFLEPFDRLQLPLRVLELDPALVLQLLPDGGGDALLLILREDRYCLTRAGNGRVEACIQAPLDADGSDEELAQELARTVRILAAQAPQQTLPVLLAGSGLTPQRQRTLVQLIPGATVPEVAFDGSRLQAAYLPALALARRAAQPERRAVCNLRQGRYLFRGNLAPYRRQLIAIAALLVLALGAVGTGFWFGYARKAGALNGLDTTLKEIYRQSYPRSPVPADVPLYMASNLKSLREKGRLLGAARTGPLQVLEAVTAGIAPSTGVDVQAFDFSAEEASLSGRAASFDAVDQLAARLQTAPVFERVQISEAKMSVDGSRVEFRIDLGLATGAGGER